MPADLAELPDRGAGLGGRCEEPAAEAVAGVGGGIQPDPPGVALHDPRRAVIRQRQVGHLPAERHRTEHRADADLRRRQPRLHRLDRPQAVATRYGHLLPLPFLVPLRPPDQHAQPVHDLGQVGDIQRAELAPPECAGETKRQQCPVALADHAVGAEGDHLTDHVRGRRRLALLGRADGPADAT